MSLVCVAIGALCFTATSDAAAPAPHSTAANPGAIPLPSEALRVPLLPQRTDYTCGNAALLSVLRYWKPESFRETTEGDLIEALGTTSHDGTEPRAIASFAAMQTGLTAELRTEATTDDLDRALARGEPTIVDIEAWQERTHATEQVPWESDYDDGHYVVLVGAGKAAVPSTPSAAEEDVYFFMDPSTPGSYAYLPKQELVARWHDVVRDEAGQPHRTQHVAIFVANTGGLSPAPVLTHARNATPID